MFRGYFEHNLNNQGRVSLPAKFRQVLETNYSPKLVLVGLPDKIEAWPEEEYRKKELADMNLPDDDPMVEEYLLMRHLNVWEVELDGTGRILLPPKLRTDLELTGEVVFVGRMDRILIYRPDVLKNRLEGARSRYQENSLTVSRMRNPKE